jgi:putative glutamine amidotransferase
MTSLPERPLIGITASRETIPTSVGPLPFYTQPTYYAEAVTAAGGIPLILPPSADWHREILDILDGLIVSGGEDVEPQRYGQEPHPTVQWVDPVRDEFELEVVRYAFDRDRPLLGVCRGAQVLNVAAGGTLVQDLASQHPNLASHTQDQLHTVTHAVELAPATRLRAAIGAGSLSVNSGHHQAIHTVSARLKPVAWASDGVIEAAESPDRTWIVGVQWHPEMLYAEHVEHRRLFEALVQAARESRRSRHG